MNKHLKNLINFLFFLLIDLFIGLRKREIVPKTILLIRLDSIGDYILFRNFIKFLKENNKFHGYTFTLCGNRVWEDLAKNLDSNWISEFIWLDRDKFLKNIFYKISFLKIIYSKGFDTVLNFTYSRELLFGDQIVKSSRSTNRIGFSSSPEKEKRTKIFSNRFYTDLIQSTEDNIFEFYRNKELVEKLIEKEIFISKPSIDVSKFKFSFNYKTPIIVVFPGAKDFKRRWNAVSFSEVCKHLIYNYKFKIILAGSKDDIELGNQINNLCGSSEIENLCGSTSLLELAKLISVADLLISNETSAVHFAAAVSTPFICISNGNHFGRFNPYPKEIFNYGRYIYPPEIMGQVQNFASLSEKYRFNSDLDINSINPETVINLIKKVLK